MSGHDIERVCTKVQGNWLRIDREIEEKHALQIYQNNCGFAMSSSPRPLMDVFEKSNMAVTGSIRAWN